MQDWYEWRQTVKEPDWTQWEYERTMRRRLRILRATFIGVGIALGATLIVTRFFA